MENNKTSKSAVSETLEKSKSKECFIIMPISDCEGYDPGHFKRVYDYIIKPACERAGYIPYRADDTQKANVIVIDILKQIVDSDIAICDLSSRNPNVFYELGMRQAFNLKTVLIKDNKTPRPFDIQGLRTVDYNENLRVDEVNRAIESLANALSQTESMTENEVNSMVQLLSIEAPAKLTTSQKISPEGSIILNEMKSLRKEVQELKNTQYYDSFGLNMDRQRYHYINDGLIRLSSSPEVLKTYLSKEESDEK